MVEYVIILCIIIFLIKGLVSKKKHSPANIRDEIEHEVYNFIRKGTDGHTSSICTSEVFIHINYKIRRVNLGITNIIKDDIKNGILSKKT